MRSIKLPSLLFVISLFGLLWLAGAVNLGSFDTFAQISKCDILTPQGVCTIDGAGNPPGAIDFQVSVSGFVPETAIQLKGYTAPGAFVIVSEGTDVVGAATAESDGAFDFTLHALQAGSPHALSIIASTSYQTTPGTGFVVTPVANSLVTVDNITLPPFIQVTPTSADLGNPFTIYGEAAPGATVNVFVESPLVSATTVVDANGDWSIDTITEFGVLPQGSYITYAYQSVGAFQSNNSQIISFEVRETQSTTFLAMNGYGPPGAFMTIKNGNTVVGSGIVDVDGTFSNTVSFPDVNATVDMSIVVDDGDQVSLPTEFSANLISTQTTTVDDILLPTFISVSPLIANEGSAITASGVATPNATVTLTIESPTKTVALTSDASGAWSQELIAEFGSLPEGVYTASAIVSLPGLTDSVESRTITFTVTEVTTATDLVVEGMGPPGAFISFTENSLVIGTDTIHADGQFSHTLKFSDQTLPHTISIVASNDTQQTPPTTFTVTVNAFSVTTVSNIILPTFIEVVPKSVPYGDTVIAKGTAVPNALVMVYMREPLVSKPTTSGPDGKWQLDLNTIAGTINKGKYTAYARVTTLPDEYQSGLSREVEFEVIEADECAIRRSDLNCDNRVDITDLGILIFYWGTAGAGQKADINQDGTVNIQDVGIMVYDWTY